MVVPAPDADPDRHQLKERNVAALHGNFTAAGARVLIVSGVVDPVGGPDLDVLGDPRIHVARLRTDPDELRARLRLRNGQLRPVRGSPDQDEGAVEFAAVLDQSGFADSVIDTTRLSIDQVAASALEHVDAWLKGDGQAGITPARTSEPSRAIGELLWVLGPTGVGKSTIGHRAYLDVVQSGVCGAFVDADQLGFCHSAASAPSLRAQNLAAVWSNYAEVDARLGVVVGGVSLAEDARRYERELPETTITWCQLCVDDAELTRRIRSRGEAGSWAQPGDPLRGRTEAELLEVADRAIATASLLHKTNVGVPITVDGLDVQSAADHLLRSAHWPQR